MRSLTAPPEGFSPFYLERIRYMRTLSLGCAALAAMVLAPQAASAQAITYVVSQQIGSGSVIGQIATDGTLGTLAANNVSGWNLALNGVGASYNIATANSAVVIQGGGVVASAQNLTFNYASGSSYILFQQGLFSGNHYWCNSAAAGACRQGATVAPESAFDASAQFAAGSGIAILGTASGPINVTTVDALNDSLNNLALTQKAQLITANLYSQILLGKNEQVSCGDCGGAGLTFGSLSFSAHGRKAITPELTALFGVAIGHYEEKGAFITQSVTFAGGFRFDPATMGSSRPYLEIGGAIAPDQHGSYQRSYVTGAGVVTGVGSIRTTNISLYAHAGWVARLTKRDELAGGVSVGHSWQRQSSYQEQNGSTNPFDAQYNGGVMQLSTAGASAQYTHLFGRRIEVGVDGTVARSFGSKSSIDATIEGFGSKNVITGEITYFEPGARIGFRINGHIKIDAFINATVANQSIGTSKHGGFGLNILL